MQVLQDWHRENCGLCLVSSVMGMDEATYFGPCSKGCTFGCMGLWGDFAGPYGLRWCGPKSFTDVGAHVVCVHRLSLDLLTPSQFIWMPYTDDVLDKLVEHCREGNDFWSYRGPFICFYIVEQHQSDRCVRLFGMIQDIRPPTVVYSKDLYNINLKGKSDADRRKSIKNIYYAGITDCSISLLLIILV